VLGDVHEFAADTQRVERPHPHLSHDPLRRVDGQVQDAGGSEFGPNAEQQQFSLGHPGRVHPVAALDRDRDGPRPVRMLLQDLVELVGAGHAPHDPTKAG
jgi:hypothetical protein